SHKGLKELVRTDERLGRKRHESFQFLRRKEEQDFLVLRWRNAKAKLSTNPIEIPERPVGVLVDLVLNVLMRIAGNNEEVMLGCVLRRFFNRFARFRRTPSLMSFALKDPDLLCPIALNLSADIDPLLVAPGP